MAPIPPPPSLPADVVANATNFYADFQAPLEKYHGGMPVGFLAAIAAREGAYLGRPWPMLQGDPNLGELGYFQVESAFPPSVRLPAAVRASPEGNVFCGALEYQVHAVRVWQRYPQLFSLGSADNWLFARLAFAIGDGGLDAVVRAAQLKPPGTPPPGSGIVAPAYQALIAWAKRTGAFAISPMTAGLVASRIVDAYTLWQVGQVVKPGLARAPQAIPTGSWGPYVLPSDVGAVLQPQTMSDLLLALAVAGALLL